MQFKLKTKLQPALQPLPQGVVKRVHESDGRTPFVLFTLLLLRLPFEFRLNSLALPFELRLFGDNNQKLEPERKTTTKGVLVFTARYFGANSPASIEARSTGVELLDSQPGRQGGYYRGLTPLARGSLRELRHLCSDRILAELGAKDSQASLARCLER